MVLLIIGFLCLSASLILFYKANQITLVKNKEQEQYKEQLESAVTTLLKDRNDLINSQLEQKKEFEQQLSEWQDKRKQEIELYLKNQRELADQSVHTAYEDAQRQIIEINNNIQITRNSAIEEKEQLQTELNKLKSSLSAGVEARLREQEKKEQINFYKLSINDADLSDVKMLENLKSSLHTPVVLSKLIWTQYFQKQMTELCDRVLGKKTICGIYKITNILTQQCYIGQSVNISDRWKQHCKCGLGIEASATNALYNAMQRDGVWNYTFELLEECSRGLLNEKEAFWIDMYSSNIYGLNTMKGRIG